MELLVLHFLVECLFVDDDLVPIDQVFLEIVGEDAFQGLHIVRFAHFFDRIGDLVVEIAWFDQSDGSLHCFVRSQNHISLLASDCRLGIRLHNDGMGSESSESIDMSAQFDFDEIALLDGGGLLRHWGVVATDFVDRDAGGEGDSLEDLFLVEDFAQFVDEGRVAEQTQVEDLGAD